MSVLALAAALFLAGILFAAGASKLRHAARYARLMDAYAVLPAGAGVYLVPVLGVLEIIAAAGLLTSSRRGAAAVLVLVILLLYSAAISLNLLRGRRDIDCGCGGLWGHQPLSGALLLRNAALILCATAPLLIATDRAHALADWLVALAIAVAAWIINTLCALVLARDALMHDD